MHPMYDGPGQFFWVLRGASQKLQDVGCIHETKPQIRREGETFGVGLFTLAESEVNCSGAFAFRVV